MELNHQFKAVKQLKAGRISPIAKIIFVMVVLCIFSVQGLAQSPEISWIEGPVTVDLGDNLAQVEMGAAYAFAGADDTVELMEMMGNPPSGTEVGLIIPIDENADWFIVFEYDAIGYVKDDEKNDLDADAILDSIKEGTEEGNKIRAEQGFPPLNIIGWYEKPHYDEASNNLVWAVQARSDDDEADIVNYNVRLLGRTGYMSVVLVSDLATLDTIKPELNNIIQNFSYKQGKSYASFVEGDKVAQYGLTALVVGGAGTAAAKAGIFKSLAKFAKYIFLAIIAFFGGMWKKIKGFFSKDTGQSFENGA